MYERFTDRARKVMQLANEEAQRFNHEYIGTEHILLGLVKEGTGVAANVLRNLDINLRMVRLEVERLIQGGPDMVTMGKLPKTPRAKKVIEYSMEEARGLGHNYVGTEHLLLGLLREDEGVASQVLMNLGLKLEAARNEVLALLGHAPVEQRFSPRVSGQPWCLSLPMGRGTQHLLCDAATVARWFAHKHVCTGYLLLGIVHTSGTAAGRALARSGITAAAVAGQGLVGDCFEPEAQTTDEASFTAPRR